MAQNEQGQIQMENPRIINGALSGRRMSENTDPIISTERKTKEAVMDAVNRVICWQFLIGLQVFWLVGCVGSPSVDEVSIEDRTIDEVSIEDRAIDEVSIEDRTIDEVSIEDRTILKITMTKEVAAVYVSTSPLSLGNTGRPEVSPSKEKATGAGKVWKVDLEKLNLAERIPGSGGVIVGTVGVTIEWVNKNDTRGKRHLSMSAMAEVVYEEGVSKRRLTGASVSENQKK